MSEFYDDSFTISTTNYLTGEISEIEIKNPDQAANELEKLVASERAIKLAISKLKTYIDREMGEDDKVRFGNFEVLRVQRETRTWTREGLRAVGFDDDALSVVSKINMTAARALVNEAIERGEVRPDIRKELDDSAERSITKPYLTFKQVG